MNENKVDIKDPTLLVDINEATLAVKESRFADALETLKINLSRYPDHIDSLYLAAVSARYLKKYDDAKKYIEIALSIISGSIKGLSPLIRIKFLTFLYSAASAILCATLFKLPL